MPNWSHITNAATYKNVQILFFILYIPRITKQSLSVIKICISLRELRESNTSVTYRTLSLLQITIHPNVASVQIFSRSCSLITRPSDTSTDSNRFQRGYTTCVALAVISPSEIWKQSKGDNSKSVTLSEKRCNNKIQTF